MGRRIWKDCPECDGTGYVQHSGCWDCSCTGGPEAMACMGECKVCDKHFAALDAEYIHGYDDAVDPPTDDDVATSLNKDCSACGRGPDCGSQAAGCLGPQKAPPYAYRHWIPIVAPSENWINRLGVCGIGRVGFITDRKYLPWGLAWIGTGLDGKEWSSRNPKIPTEEQVADALKAQATKAWKEGFKSAAKMAEDATDGRVTLTLQEGQGE